MLLSACKARPSLGSNFTLHQLHSCFFKNFLGLILNTTIVRNNSIIFAVEGEGSQILVWYFPTFLKDNFVAIMLQLRHQLLFHSQSRKPLAVSKISVSSRQVPSCPEPYI